MRASAAARIVLAVLLVSTGASATARVGPAVPATAIDVRSGERVEIGGRGAVTHLVFFATWCPPCLDELARLAELHATWAARGYRLVVVGVDRRQTRERLATFLSDERPPGELVFDEAGALSRAYAVERLPTHVVLDASGAVVRRAPALSADLVSDLTTRLAGAASPSR